MTGRGADIAGVVRDITEADTGTVWHIGSTPPLVLTVCRETSMLLRAERGEADPRRAAARVDQSRARQDADHQTVSTEGQSVASHVEMLQASNKSC